MFYYNCNFVLYFLWLLMSFKVMRREGDSTIASNNFSIFIFSQNLVDSIWANNKRYIAFYWMTKFYADTVSQYRERIQCLCRLVKMIPDHFYRHRL